MKKILLLIIVLIGCIGQSRATHIIGAEIGYNNLGNQAYEVYVHVYADCDGQSFPLFNNMALTRAQVIVYNGFSQLTTLDLPAYGEYGKEITPVCDADTNNTTCRNGTIPGIAEFKFKTTINLNVPSANWRFVFTGELGTSTAGRTNIISNIGPNSTLYVEATLNNLMASNNTPELTTIPTPFFCNNLQQEYNPGAFDLEGDSLHFSLQPARQFINSNISPVSYVLPFSYLQPLSTAVGGFNFNQSNGQLSFVPNLVQISVVVYQIDEYRNGVKVGSMQREMNFIVLDNCANRSPGGSIASTNVGIIASPRVLEVCNVDSVLDFSVNAFDPDNQAVDVTVTGLPAGLTYNVVGNGTNGPVIDFHWDMITPMVYGSSFNFFITFQDDGCPISSKQQLAYTVQVVNPFQSTITPDVESCVPGKDGQINMSVTSTNGGGYQYALNNGSMQGFPFFAGLSQGTYTVSYEDSRACSNKEVVTIEGAEQITIIEQRINDVSCFGLGDGAVQFNTTPANYATDYTLLPTNQTATTPRFNALDAGAYTVIANAPYGCADTLNFSIVEPPELSFTSIVTQDDQCALGQGKVSFTSNGGPSIIYTISAPQQTNKQGVFGGLYKGRYAVNMIDINNCGADSVFTIGEANYPFSLSINKTDVSCEADGNDGSAQLTINGGTPPYTILWNTPASETTQNITQQRSGIKTLAVTDAIGCTLKDYTFIDPANCCDKVFFPNAFSPNDDGLNDSWRMRTPLTIDIQKFNVYNRWGQVVWRSDNQLSSWNGTYNDKRVADIGTYYYILKYKCLGDDNTYIKKGDVMLIR